MKTGHRIDFLPLNKSGYFRAGTCYRDAALELGILIESSCAGLGTCGKCKVKIQDGAEPLNEAEKSLLTAQEQKKDVRLACQARVMGPSTCIIPPESMPSGDQILAHGLRSSAALDPDLRKIAIQPRAARLGEKYFDFETARLVLAEHGCPVRQFDFRAVRALPDCLGASDRLVTAVVDGSRLLTFEAGNTCRHLYGVALDIGTTTVVAQLIDLTNGDVLATTASINLQAAHGADVVARINYIQQHPGGLKRLHRLIVKQINAMLETLCGQADVARTHVYKLVVAANTVMQHILLNVTPTGLGQKPYVPVIQGPVSIPASDLGVELHPHGVVYCLANLASFVGSDITSVLTVLDITEGQDVQLAVDMGTNGEIVLGSRDRVLCTSSPAGPAWEGACISWGMRAATGAIERAEIVDGELICRTIGGGAPVGICGSGLIDLVCAFLRAGIIGPTGRIDQEAARQNPTLASRVEKRADGLHIVVAHLPGGRNISLSQNDIREIQLAKGAVAAGIRILMQELNIETSDISRVYIAGAFGNHILGRDVLELGMVPPIAEDAIVFVGNAALNGAAGVLCSSAARRKAEDVAARVAYVEVADRRDFQDYFVESMTLSPEPINEPG